MNFRKNNNKQIKCTIKNSYYVAKCNIMNIVVSGFFFNMKNKSLDNFNKYY